MSLFLPPWTGSISPAQPHTSWSHFSMDLKDQGTESPCRWPALFPSPQENPVFTNMIQLPRDLSPDSSSTHESVFTDRLSINLQSTPHTSKQKLNFLCHSHQYLKFPYEGRSHSPAPCSGDRYGEVDTAWWKPSDGWNTKNIALYSHLHWQSILHEKQK